KDVYRSLKEEIGDYVTLTDLGYVMRRMGNLDTAEQLHLKCLTKLNITDDENISICYENLGIVSADKGDSDKPLTLINDSIKIKLKSSMSYT
ncbi:unnamed protein product, partial [Didymodactylos carnosus]